MNNSYLTFGHKSSIDDLILTGDKVCLKFDVDLELITT